MSLRTKIIAGVVFPLQERLKGHSTVSVRRALEQSQWLSPEEIRARQLADLRQFLSDIGANVPYYRELFKQLEFKPEAVASLDDLKRLPLLDKQTIRANQSRLIRDGARNLVRSNTGGSSGEPLVFYVGKERVSHDVAAKWRATRWWGVDIGDPEIVVWGSPIELGAQDRLRLWRDRLMRSELLSAFEMSPENLESFVDRIQRKRPAMLFGYPSSLAKIAEFAELRGARLSNSGIRVAFVTSERLYPYQRDAIQRVFGCPVANGYGGRDAGFIAHECPQRGLHVTSEDLIIEIVDKDGRSLPAGDAGEIVVTHLRTGDFPFVRYRTGDIGVEASSPCACGRGLPLLASVEGRSTDFVFAQDGTLLHGLSLIYILRKQGDVREFRIEQLSLQKVMVEIVPNGELSSAAIETISTQFRARLGAGVTVEVRTVAEISREKSGKYRYVVSHVIDAHATPVKSGFRAAER